MKSYREHREPKPWAGLAAGVVGGLTASWIMTQFQSVWSKAAQAASGPEEESKQKQEGEGDDATMKAADRLARLATGQALKKDQKKKAGPIVHYAFGAAMGGVYGAASEYMPSARTGFGLLFGTVLFLLADEVAVPALGLSKKPSEFPLSSHAYGLASHLVYGATTEAVRRGVRYAA